MGTPAGLVTMSPFIELNCSVNKDPRPIKVRADHITSILVGSPGADVWDVSGQCHRVEECPDEVEEMVVKKLGELGFINVLVPIGGTK